MAGTKDITFVQDRRTDIFRTAGVVWQLRACLAAENHKGILRDQAGVKLQLVFIAWPAY